VVLLEQALQPVFGVGFEQTWRTALEGLPCQIRFVERTRQAVEHLLHEGPPGYAIGAVDIGTQVGGRTVHDRLWHVRLAKPRHAEGERGCFDESRKYMRVHPDRRDAVLLERRRQPDDRRATGASKSDAEDRGLSVDTHPGAHLLVV